MWVPVPPTVSPDAPTFPHWLPRPWLSTTMKEMMRQGSVGSGRRSGGPCPAAGDPGSTGRKVSMPPEWTQKAAPSLWGAPKAWMHSSSRGESPSRLGGWVETAADPAQLGPWGAIGAALRDAKRTPCVCVWWKGDSKAHPAPQACAHTLLAVRPPSPFSKPQRAAPHPGAGSAHSLAAGVGCPPNPAHGPWPGRIPKAPAAKKRAPRWLWSLGARGGMNSGRRRRWSED